MPPVRKLRTTVASVEDHGEDVYTVTLVPESPVPAFRAGQFLHLALDAYDPSSHWPESRVFSIANAPSNREMLRVTYTVKGPYTRRMAAEIKPGAEVWVKLPYGSFRIEPEPGREMALVAGGTGITPFISFLELACAKGCDAPIHLFYGVRKPPLALYQPLIEEAKHQLSAFSYHLFSEETDAMPEGATAGRLAPAQAAARVRDKENAIFYLSGPPIMIDVFRSGLTGLGIASAHIRVDDWD